MVNPEIDPEGYVLEQQNYDIVRRRRWAWKKIEQLARTAESENVRLAALREFILRTDPVTEHVDAGRPVQVAIILQGAEPRTALPTNGVRLHLSSNDESGA